MGSCCCAEKPKKEEGTHAQLQEDKTQATERQDVQQSAEQQQKKASGESANKSDGAAADHQRRLSSKETKRSTQGPLRSREKVSSKVPVIEGAYGVADRPLTPPSAPQAYGVADRPMGFRSAERTSTHKRPVMEGAYGVADRPKSSAPAVQAYGVVDRPVAQPSAKQMHGGFFDVVRQQQLAHAHANRGMAGGAPRAPSLSQPVRIQTQGGGAK